MCQGSDNTLRTVCCTNTVLYLDVAGWLLFVAYEQHDHGDVAEDNHEYDRQWQQSQPARATFDWFPVVITTVVFC